ncbi:DNA cytosine methyltransferase [Cellulomonas fengjieae]|uniref:Cytosine-specific methyltransferase n=1 Tax=Cellulomonas fengjieae TaxID=2819978 RepID=A0ABS3SHF6_9CELL|nr:DNA cytosine methyltransferase [Cellulomonas fengjieae]MBO3085180.1 DNA cytosine methyltransferase [Cellulomonas fengjieae]QVI66248.1 DNA cytosine methyltransferase [Cellulomonas fengjieae]
MTALAPTPAFRFVDLFAGIGGFHAALAAYGGECRYAVEIDRAAAAVYDRNWGHNPLGDITKDADEGVMKVPAHDVLAAGLPCQPFSKSGAQRGMEETRGTLWFNTLRIIEEHHPSVVLIENVRNLAGPRHDHEWKIIVKALRQEGYRVADKPAIFSPHLLPPELGGRPQVRERVFVTATYNPKGIGDDRPAPVATMADRFNGWGPDAWDLETHLPLDPDHHVSGCDLSTSERLWIDAWDDFVQLMWERVEGGRLPGFPIWADHWVTETDLEIPLGTPSWRRIFLIKNSQFYSENQEVLDAWAGKWGVFTEAFPPSRRKLEWQAQDTPTLWETVMHLRPSGLRAKRPTYVPALVAITQTSIVGPRERRLSPREAARLQGLPEGFDFGAQSNGATYKQLGNGVNTGVVWHILREHVNRDRDILKTTAKGKRILAAVDAAPAAPDKVLAEMFPVKG